MKKAKVLKRVSIVVGLILLVGIIVLLIMERVPIEKKYSLEDVEENQAVMGVNYYYYGSTKIALVTKSGQWKCTDMTEIKNKNMSLPVKDRKNYMELIDEIMMDESIPYQDSKFEVSQEMMEKAINLQKFSFTYQEKSLIEKGWETPNTVPYLGYVVYTGTGTERGVISIGRKGDGARYRFDINIMMMIHKLDQLEAMRKEVME